MDSRLDRCRILTIPRFTDVRGSLCVAEGAGLLPFQPKRFYYLFDIPGDVDRGGHAHKKEEELVIAVSGNFTISLSDGLNNKTMNMTGPDEALYIPKMIWHTLCNFSADAICTVLASELYDPDDYHNSFLEFTEAIRKSGGK